MWNFYRSLVGRSPIFGFYSAAIGTRKKYFVRYRCDGASNGFFEFYTPPASSHRPGSKSHFESLHERLTTKGYEHILTFDFSDEKRALVKKEGGPLYRDAELGPSLCDDVKKIGDYLVDMHYAAIKQEFFHARGLPRSNMKKSIWLKHFLIYQIDVLGGNSFNAVQLGTSSNDLVEIGGLLYDHWAPERPMEYDLLADSPCPIW